jgi:hypothetical protein
MKTVGIVLVVLAMVAAGCGILMDHYPTMMPKGLSEYVNTPVVTSVAAVDNAPIQEPIKAGITTIGKAEAVKEAAVVKHLVTQLDLKAAMEKDQAVYTEAIAQAALHIQQAIAERESMIGSIDKPGWLMTLLLGATGLGAYFTGIKTQRPQDWNETEHQAELEKVKAETRASVLAEIAMTAAIGTAAKTNVHTG